MNEIESRTIEGKLSLLHMLEIIMPTSTETITTRTILSAARRDSIATSSPVFPWRRREPESSPTPLHTRVPGASDRDPPAIAC